MVDLSTSYLGFNLKNPIVAASSPLSKSLDRVRRLEDAGVSAVVLYSLFEEQIIHDSRALDYFLTRGSESFAEAVTYFPDLDHYNVGAEGYLELISSLKRSVEIPVIASLNGFTSEGWQDYAGRIQQAGADALELNVYYMPTEKDITSQEVENAYIDLVGNVRSEISIPLAVKLCPFITALPRFASSLVKEGANGLVLFNRFMQPDLDIETLEVDTSIPPSTSAEMRLPLHWVAILYGRVKANLALTGGVHTAADVIKATMAGANVVMLASELLNRGLERVGEILNEISQWMEKFDYRSVEQMTGCLSQKAVKNPSAFGRGNYMKALASFDDKLI